MTEKEKNMAKLLPKYERFLETKAGKAWLECRKNHSITDEEIGFRDYLYDFYPEYSMQWREHDKRAIKKSKRN